MMRWSALLPGERADGREGRSRPHRRSGGRAEAMRHGRAAGMRLRGEQPRGGAEGYHLEWPCLRRSRGTTAARSRETNEFWSRVSLRGWFSYGGEAITGIEITPSDRPGPGGKRAKGVSLARGVL